jgi:copper(I)-binding protein
MKVHHALVRTADRIGIIIAVALTIAAGAAMAHSTRVGAVQIGHAWVLPSPEGLRETAGFVPLLSQGREDRLVRVTSPRAENVEIRRTDDRGRGVDLGSLRLQAGAPIAMRPGRLHLAFLGIDRPWTSGERIPIRLEFEHAGVVDFEAWVEPAPYATQPR